MQLLYKNIMKSVYFGYILLGLIYKFREIKDKLQVKRDLSHVYEVMV